MATKIKPKTLNRNELIQLVIGLSTNDSFIVNTPTERGVATGVAHTLRHAGVIKFTVASRQTDDGKFIFFKVPKDQGVPYVPEAA